VAFLATKWLTGRLSRIALHISADTLLDRVAWLNFAIGVWAMLRVAFVSMLEESDGDFRTWERMRLHKLLFFSAAVLGVVGPLCVTIVQRRVGRTIQKANAIDDGLD